ncbi:MAG: hypothetical protein HY726_08975 [Candidatus Rokubacteria bacterium]|nr:hypothetical protein [Candidatus Rokubacteria bacterium]
MTEPVFSFSAEAGEAWDERIRAAFDQVRHRRHLEALDQSPVLEALAENLDRAWVAVHRPGPGQPERFVLNEAALAVCGLAGLQLPPAEPVAGALPRPLTLLRAGERARAPAG